MRYLSLPPFSRLSLVVYLPVFLLFFRSLSVLPPHPSQPLPLLSWLSALCMAPFFYYNIRCSPFGTLLPTCLLPCAPHPHGGGGLFVHLQYYTGSATVTVYNELLSLYYHRRSAPDHFLATGTLTSRSTPRSPSFSPCRCLPIPFRGNPSLPHSFRS